MHRKLECSDELLLGILNQNAGCSTELDLQHLDNCEHCQARIEELAANEQQWALAREGLCSRFEGGLDFENEFEIPTRFIPIAEHPSDWTDAMAKQLLQPPSHPEMLGRLGRYEIERLVGSGGMGVVFKAYDSELHRSVAIKMLAPHLSGSRSARERFAREARAAAAIVNDHVVPIHNVETEHATPYLVMQYIAGDSLQARLDRDGPLDVCEILRIGMQVATGLAAAHAQGLIHRDVKPSNIMLDENVARALLADFGLARTQDEACLTRSGFHPGTPHYMSPEQVRGEELDGRSDLFSLGCVLYALCTGHPPYRADSGYAVMRRITDEQPRSIREQNGLIPEWLDRVVMRLLEKDRESRFQSAEELAHILEQCLAHVQKPTTEPLPLAVVPKASFIDRGRIQNWILAGMASAFLFFAGIFIALETNKGTITIKSEADNVPIRIKRSEKIVDEMIVSRTGKSVRLAAGEYIIEFDGDSHDLVVEGGNVSLVRGDTKTLQIAYRKSAGAETRMSAEKSASKIDKSDVDKTPTPLLDFSKVKISTFESDLTAAVEEFNQLHSEKLRASKSPPLTKDELVASLWWQYSQSKLREEISETVKEIVIARKLPPGWFIKLNSREWDLPQQWWHEKPLSSSAIQINLFGKEGLATTIRNQFVSSDISSIRPPESALEKAIEEFNKSHSGEPDLTLDETLAALSTIWGKQSWYSSDGLTPSTMDALMAVIDRHEMKGVKIRLLHSYQTAEGDNFDVWSIRLEVQNDQDGSTQAFTIRERFQKVNSFSDETIHWGKPSDEGLQAGFRFKPAQTMYLNGQVVDVEFFYRSIYGKGLTATIPNAFYFNKIEIDVLGTDGKQRLTVEDDREKMIAGWRWEEIREQPVLFKHRKIRFVDSPEKLAVAKQITDDWTTNVMLPINTKFDITFDVPDFVDTAKKSGSLLTSRTQFTILNGSDDQRQRRIAPDASATPWDKHRSFLQSALDSLKQKFDQGLASQGEVFSAELELLGARITGPKEIESLPALLQQRADILQQAYLAAKTKYDAGLIGIEEFSQAVAELINANFAARNAAIEALASPKLLTTREEVETHVASIVKERQKLLNANVEFNLEHIGGYASKRRYHVWLNDLNKRTDCRGVSGDVTQDYSTIVTPTFDWFEDRQDKSNSQFNNRAPKDTVGWGTLGCIIDVRKIGLINGSIESLQSHDFDEDMLPKDRIETQVETGDHEGTPITIVKIKRKTDKSVDFWSEYWLSPSQGNYPIYIASRWTAIENPEEKFHVTQHNQWKLIDGIWFPTSIKHRFQCETKNMDNTSNFELIAAQLNHQPFPNVFDPNDGTEQ